MSSEHPRRVRLRQDDRKYGVGFDGGNQQHGAGSR